MIWEKRWSVLFLLFCSGYVNAIDLTVLKTTEIKLPDTFGGGYATNVGKHILIADVKEGNLVLFDKKGNLLSTSGSKGVGPGEMLTPLKMAFRNGFVLVSDIMRMGIHRFRLENEKLTEPTFIKLMFTPLDIEWANDDALVVGYHQGAAKVGWAQLVSLKDKGHAVTSLISREKVLGMSAEKERAVTVRNESLAASYLVTVCEPMVFTCWGGRMRIVARNLESGKEYVFGENGRFYREPADTKALEKIYALHAQGSVADEAKERDERDKLCLINSMAATQNSLFVGFQSPAPKNKNVKNTVLQQYNHEGRLIGDIVLSSFFERENIEEQDIMVQAFDDHRDGELLVMEYVVPSDEAPLRMLIHTIQVK